MKHTLKFLLYPPSDQRTSLMRFLDFFAWYPADYRADTVHLTREEDFAYRAILDEIFLTNQESCRIEDDDRYLARVAKATDDEWKSIRVALIDGPRAPLTKRGKWISSTRLTAEIEKARVKSKKNSEIAKEGWKKRTHANRSANAADSQSDRYAIRREESKAEEKRREKKESKSKEEKVDSAVVCVADATPPTKALTPQQVSVGRVMAALEPSEMAAPGGHVARWIATYGEEFVLAVIESTGPALYKKPPTYLHAILQTRHAQGWKPTVAKPANEPYTEPQRHAVTRDDIRDVELELKYGWERTDCTAKQAEEWVSFCRVLAADDRLTEAPSLADWVAERGILRFPVEVSA